MPATYRQVSFGKLPSLLHADFFDSELKGAGFDSAVLGIILSYFRRDEDKRLFDLLNQLITPREHILIIDSLWDEKRSNYHNKKGFEERTLNDGRKYLMFKRYLDKADIVRILRGINSL